MTPLKIRSYVQKDLKCIVEIYNEAFKNLPSCWPNPMSLSWFTKRFGAALKTKTSTALIAEYKGTRIGYILLTSLERPQVGWVALISGICVVPCFQRKGVGSKLMEKAIRWAKKQRAVLIENDDEILENSIAVSFFEKLGFEVFHRGVCMSKDLTSSWTLAYQGKHEIRELQAGDLDQLLRVRREAFKEFGPWYAKPDGEAFKRRMKSRIGRDDVKVFVAVVGNQVIGYVVCTLSETSKILGGIRNVSVLPEHRNEGVGTALVNSALSFLKAKQVETVETATETAEGFYRKVGFKVDKRFIRVRRKI